MWDVWALHRDVFAMEVAMRSRVYLRFEGAKSDLDNLCIILGSQITGSVARRRHDGSPLTKVPLDYWKSEYFEVVDEFPEDVVLRLAQTFRISTRGTKFESMSGLTAVIVSELEPNCYPGGYFFSDELIAELAMLRSKLEIDIVPKA